MYRCYGARLRPNLIFRSVENFRENCVEMARKKNLQEVLDELDVMQDSDSEFEPEDSDEDYQVENDSEGESSDSENDNGIRRPNVHAMHGVQGVPTDTGGGPSPEASEHETDDDNSSDHFDNSDNDNIALPAAAAAVPVAGRARPPRGRARGRGQARGGQGRGRGRGGGHQLQQRNVNELDPPIGSTCPNDWQRIITPNVGDAATFSPDLSWCPQFTEQGQFAGGRLKKDMEGKDPVDFFHEFFPPEIYQHITDQTNLYALQYFDDPSLELQEHSRFHSWKDATVEEMRAFVGLEIAMGLCDKPQIADYFENYWLTVTPGFSSIFSRNRFQMLRSFFHMNDNSERVRKGEPGYDTLFKVRPILEFVQDKYVKLYQARKDVSIDEAMLGFKGRLGIKQYMQDKPTKWGVKLWSLCDSSNGFMLKWNVYTGAGEGTVGDVVRSLMIPDFAGKGYILYCDNLYSSPELFFELRNRQIGACGTLRNNRIGNPVAIMPASRGRRNDATARYPRISLRKGEDPVFFKKDNALCLYWQDNGTVRVLTTIHDNSIVQKEIRKRGQQAGEGRQVHKPDAVCAYNMHMGGVDHSDQLRAYYSYCRKTMKWYQVIWHFAKEIALINGLICYNIVNPGQKMDQRKFRKKVVDSLLQGQRNPDLQERRHSRVSQKHPLARLTGQHWQGEYENPKYKPNCEVCSNHAAKIRVQTRYYCKQCNVPLCRPPKNCHERYHTLLDYKL